MEIILVIAAILSFALVVLSVYPGVLLDLFLIAILTSILWIPALLIALFVLLLRSARRSALRSEMNENNVIVSVERGGTTVSTIFGRFRMVIVTVFLIFNGVLLVTRIPIKLAFAFSRPAFEAMRIETMHDSPTGESLNRRLGIYLIDRCRADSRGGIYFRSHSGADGISPDILSSGFAYKPNPRGSPFGAARYHYIHLIDDWYSFQASDDYFQ